MTARKRGWECSGDPHQRPGAPDCQCARGLTLPGGCRAKSLPRESDLSSYKIIRKRDWNQPGRGIHAGRCAARRDAQNMAACNYSVVPGQPRVVRKWRRFLPVWRSPRRIQNMTGSPNSGPAALADQNEGGAAGLSPVTRLHRDRRAPGRFPERADPP